MLISINKSKNIKLSNFIYALGIKEIGLETSKNLSKLINLIKDQTISGKIAKSVFEMMIVDDKDPELIVNEKNLKQESDPKELEKLIDKIINENKDKVNQYKEGKEKLFGFFVGQVMKISSGKANPKLANEILKVKLSKWQKV